MLPIHNYAMCTNTQLLRYFFDDKLEGPWLKDDYLQLTFGMLGENPVIALNENAENHIPIAIEKSNAAKVIYLANHRNGDNANSTYLAWIFEPSRVDNQPNPFRLEVFHLLYNNQDANSYYKDLFDKSGLINKNLMGIINISYHVGPYGIMIQDEMQYLRLESATDPRINTAYQCKGLVHLNCATGESVFSTQIETADTSNLTASIDYNIRSAVVISLTSHPWDVSQQAIQTEYEGDMVPNIWDMLNSSNPSRKTIEFFGHRLISRIGDANMWLMSDLNLLNLESTSTSTSEV